MPTSCTYTPNLTPAPIPLKPYTVHPEMPYHIQDI